MIFLEQTLWLFTAVLFFKSFVKSTSLKKSTITKVSADKMMIKAQGPLWHQKQRKQGFVPVGLWA